MAKGWCFRNTEERPQTQPWWGAALQEKDPQGAGVEMCRTKRNEARLELGPTYEEEVTPSTPTGEPWQPPVSGAQGAAGRLWQMRLAV